MRILGALTLALMFACAPVYAQAPRFDVRPAGWQPKFKLQDAAMVKGPGPKACGYLCVDIDAYAAVMDARIKADAKKFGELFRDGKFVVVPYGTKVSIQQIGRYCFQVLVVEGVLGSKEGWISSQELTDPRPQYDLDELRERARRERETVVASRAARRERLANFHAEQARQAAAFSFSMRSSSNLGYGGGNNFGGGTSGFTSGFNQSGGGYSSSGLCGAPTKTTNGPCRNRVSGGGRCYLHR